MKNNKIYVWPLVKQLQKNKSVYLLIHKNKMHNCWKLNCDACMTLLSVAQMNSQNDIEANFIVIESLINKVRLKAAELIFPRKFCLFWTAGKQRADSSTIPRASNNDWNNWLIVYQYGLLRVPSLARFVLMVSIINDGRVRTVSLCISPEKLKRVMTKSIYLTFGSVDAVEVVYRESRFFEPGDEVVVAKTPFGNIGLMVCYDLRFPELSLMLRTKGANILTAPAAFTYTTGKLHWHCCYRHAPWIANVMCLGAAQQGMVNRRQTWGHAGITNSRGQLYRWLHWRTWFNYHLLLTLMNKMIFD